jgi:thiol:disulfide interchange protein DsbD
MRRILPALALFLGAVLACTAPAMAQEMESGGMRVHARLVAETRAIAPGTTVTVALVEDIAPGWHTYWQNPGDAGAPTRIDWTLPEGWTAGAIQWPRPKRLPVGPLMDYGYEGQLWLPLAITAPADAKPGTAVTLRAHASWLVCSNVCVPESSDLLLTLPVGPSVPDPAVAGDFAAARALLPVASPWKATYALDDGGKNLDLYIAAPSLAGAHPVSADFFPAASGIIHNAAPQRTGYADGGLVLRLSPAGKIGDTLNGLLVLVSADGSTQALEIAAPAGAVPPAVFSQPAMASAALSLWLAVAFALLGGLILNVMPCVLPILAMKAFTLARHGAEGRGESFAYAVGAIASFVVLGLAILILRAGGAAVGWGFQLQNPVAVAGFALLIFAVGLNLSGVFEVGSITAGEKLTRKGGLAGAFFTGILAVAVAAPCTAPFMAGALGFALTQSFAVALAVFVALGVGFALPFLVLGVWPRALSFLPRPGPWMLRLKQFLAFPMYGAAVWLVWVLAVQAGANSVAIVLASFVALAMAAWLWSATRTAARGRLAGVAAALLAVALSLYGVSTLRPAPAAASSGAGAATLGEPYTAAKLAQYRAEGRPVFVDATAAWCITCLVNEEAVLSRDSVKSAFAKSKVAYLVADWTNQNPEITRLLKDNGHSGVPMYLYYAPDAQKPVVLPQILTEGRILSLFDGAAG